MPATKTPASLDDAKCVLITGATSGIGRALALRIAELPSRPTVVAAGRRQDRLDALGAIEGVEPLYLDVSSDLEALKSATEAFLAKFPDLDTIILNAGIQHEFDLTKDVDLSKLLQELNVNYISVVALITYVLPHFLKRSEQGRPSFIVTVTSGLGIVPAPGLPNYSATKAALRSFTTSLRAQLDETHVHVTEIIPPLVESELHDAYGTTERLSKFWMPLNEFTELTIEGLRQGNGYIPVGTAEQAFEKFETGKEDMVNGFMKMQKQLKAQAIQS
ncbi:NAD(P)-binding protein [Pholiota conissans]|uniref:NAD(P)-binding protein n=1 Tax=Pholiota conissans TaxID=109636 RepID=A0A9P6CUX3_9AGAR|nr:NAD(P)-binding protein [Pholiota conissans]